MKAPLNLLGYLLWVVVATVSCKKERSCTNCPYGRTDNLPPVASAGIDQTILLPQDSALLDGSASADSDGRIILYRWTKIYSPSSGLIVQADSSKTIARHLGVGMYQFELTVKDNDGATAKDTVQVVVKNENG